MGRNAKKLSEPGTIIRYGFLYQAYNYHQWYYEIIDMAHKFILTSLVAFLPNEWEMTANVCFLTAYLIVQLLSCPYRLKGDDRLQMLAQANLMCLSFAGHVLSRLNVIEYDPIIDVMLTIGLVTLMSIFLLGALLMSFRNIRKWLSQRLNQGKYASEQLRTSEKSLEPGEAEDVPGQMTGVLEQPNERKLRHHTSSSENFEQNPIHEKKLKIHTSSDASVGDV
jgi:hypothetical protein